VRQEDFVQQPAKHETVPRAFDQKVVKEDDELEMTTADAMEYFEKKIQRCQETQVRWEEIYDRCEKALKKNCSDDSLDDDSSDDDSSDEG